MDKLLDVLLLGRRRFGALGPRSRAVLSQLPLNLTLLLVFVVLAFADPHALTLPPFLSGQIVALVILLLCAVVPWGRLPEWCVLAIPLLDFVAVGLVRTGATGVLSGLGLLAVFPVMWLAGSGRRLRLVVALCTFASLVMVWTPLLAIGGSAPHTFVAELVVPLMLVSVAVAMSVMTLSGIAQQQRVEELLARSETRQRLLDTVLETVDVGVLVIDDAGTDVFMNSRQRQLYLTALPPGAARAPESELLVYRDGTDELVPVEERPMGRANAGEELNHEMYRLGRGPEARTVSISARAFRDATGELAGTVLACTDVTEVVAAVRARDSFLAAMSHEFRTPLTSLLGYAELLLEDESLSTSARSDLRVMSRNARHLRKMVDDILAASVEGSSPDVRRTELDLAELVRQAAVSAAPDAESRGIAVRIEDDGELPVVGDKTGIVRILDNLVSNALKYSESGALVTLTTERDGWWAVCRVRDEGIGIPPEDLERIFTRFQRSSAALRSGIPGTGLGLALAHEVATQHGGRLECTSEVGVGSVFTLRLPLARAGVSPNQSTAAEE
ncbi:sensor histidine kinase [Sinomonas sp. P47F7]|uniref:sensor histidine kinase n=1 Tax=Sinomonas sp. P47F7 TaxID=3410987 RepID=UPI003BF4B0C6